MTNTMKIGPVAHGVLLAGALLLAYQTWTREEKVDRKIGDVKVWSEPVASLNAIEYQTKDRTIRVEWRGEGAQRYLWGRDTRVIKKPKPRSKDPLAPKDPEDPAAGPVLPEPDSDKETLVKEFAISGEDKTKDLVPDLASLRALIDLGTLDDAKKKEFGLADAEDSIDVFFDGGVSHSLLLGSKVYGGTDRYAIAVDTGRAYVIAGQVIDALVKGEAGLKQRGAHAYEDSEVGRATVKVGDKTRSLVQVKRADDKGKETKAWADGATPDQPNQTMDNFLTNVKRLIPQEYQPDVKADDLDLLVRVEYQTPDGKPLGWAELYKEKPAPEEAPAEGAPAEGAPAEGAPAADGATPAEGAAPAEGAVPAEGEAPAESAAKPADKPKPKAPPKYYLRTEATRVLATTSSGAAKRIDEDLDQLFTAE